MQVVGTLIQRGGKGGLLAVGLYWQPVPVLSHDARALWRCVHKGRAGEKPAPSDVKAFSHLGCPAFGAAVLSSCLVTGRCRGGWGHDTVPVLSQSPVVFVASPPPACSLSRTPRAKLCCLFFFFFFFVVACPTGLFSGGVGPARALATLVHGTRCDSLNVCSCRPHVPASPMNCLLSHFWRPSAPG